VKDELRYIGQKIVESHFELAQNVEKIIEVSYARGLKKSGAPKPMLLEFRAEFIRYVGECLYEDIDTMTRKVSEWAVNASQFAIDYNISLSNSLRSISFYRTVIWNLLHQELSRRNFASITMLDISRIIDPIIDKVFIITGEQYEKHDTSILEN
jgi:rsbT co-antagonist protein RsbR